MKLYFERTAGSTFMISIREAFISLLPFLIILSLFTLSSSLLSIFQLLPDTQRILYEIAYSLNVCFAPLAAVAIGFQFSKNINVSVMAVLALGLSSLVVVVLLSMDDPSELDVETIVKDPRLILAMLASAYVLKFFEAKANLRFIHSSSVSQHLKRHFHLLIPSLLSVIVIPMILVTVTYFASFVLKPLINILSDVGPESLISLRVFLSNLFWGIGLHGANTFHILVEQSIDGVVNYYTFPLAANLPMSQFSDLFVNFGGGGATWCLIIAILLFSKDGHSRRIAMIAAPFALFNINEILIFALPIAFNIRLLVPFLFVPLINCWVGLFVVKQQWFEFVSYQHSWVVPDLVNIYLATSGNMLAVLTQLLLILVGVALYWPFVIAGSVEEQLQEAEQVLRKKLSLRDDMDLLSERHLVKKHQEQRRSIKATFNAIDDVNKGQLLLYYQPKVSLVSGQLHGLEALLRLKRADGKVVGPYFLDALQKEGFSLPIDNWVVQEVGSTLTEWKQQGFSPKVSINLDPNNLLHPGFVKHLIQHLQHVGEQVELELIESSYMEYSTEIEKVLIELQEYGIGVSIDDFGTGFSCLSMLTKISAQTIKIDKSMLDEAQDEKGAILYKEICRMCQNLNFELVAEGVETKTQIDFVQALGVELIQGWYFSPALPAEDIISYQPQRHND